MTSIEAINGDSRQALSAAYENHPLNKNKALDQAGVITEAAVKPVDAQSVVVEQTKAGRGKIMATQDPVSGRYVEIYLDAMGNQKDQMPAKFVVRNYLGVNKNSD